MPKNFQFRNLFFDTLSFPYVSTYSFANIKITELGNLNLVFESLSKKDFEETNVVL